MGKKCTLFIIDIVAVHTGHADDVGNHVAGDDIASVSNTLSVNFFLESYTGVLVLCIVWDSAVRFREPPVLSFTAGSLATFEPLLSKTEFTSFVS